jgi:two-component system, response regulator
MSLNLVELLLVEDNIYEAEMTTRVLKKHELAHHLHHAKDGEDALEFIFATGKYKGKRCMEAAPKLILLDIHMPKVNGIEVLQQIRADEQTKYIPVVILTSSMENPDIEKCYSLGANSYIVKPVDFEKLAVAVKETAYYWLFLNQTTV